MPTYNDYSLSLGDEDAWQDEATHAVEEDNDYIEEDEEFEPYFAEEDEDFEGQTEHWFEPECPACSELGDHQWIEDESEEVDSKFFCDCCGIAKSDNKCYKVNNA